MSLPTVLDVKPIKVPQEIEDGSLSVGAYVEVKIPFNLQKQEQDNWCWAAMTDSVNKFFDPTTSWTQCKLASAHFTGNNCCINGASAACNQPYATRDALRDLGNLGSIQTKPAGFQTIMNEINGNRPLACRMEWRGGGAHVVAAYGFAQADYDGLFDQWVFVKDPGQGIGDSKYLYNKFKTEYQGIGQWAATYLTKG
jgi:Papain-like cysteine protease AvrRpt2